MGLDMYLYATKTITDPDTVTIIDKLIAQLPSHQWDDPDDAYFALWDHTKPEEKALGLELIDVVGLTPLRNSETFFVGVRVIGDTRKCSMTVAYWRKANAIHGWFVDNCQGGVDECQTSDDIPAEQLAHLVHLCEQALNPDNDPEQILPPVEGFFFGGYDIDEWYRRALQETIDQLSVVLQAAAHLGGNITFNYHSSW